MENLIKRRLLFGTAMFAYTILLAVFYWKYVPIVAAYQAALVPLLLIVTIVTTFDIRRGLLVFIFLFPLINNLPYFFKLYEPLPMAPSALVLFLFFFLGWLLHQAFAASPPVGDETAPSEPIFAPLRLFAALVIVSALITFWRYTNFFPLWRPRVYELVTNTYGTSAGGAIMSVVFFSLTYLTGIAFFMILAKEIRTEAFLRKAVIVLSASTMISVGFGLIQHFYSLTLGNNPLSIKLGLINATFKDALSFGAFLSIIIPFFTGLFLSVKRRLRFVFLPTVVLSIYLMFYTGSKISLISLWASLFFLTLIFIKNFYKRRRPFPKKLFLVVAAVVLVSITAAFFKTKVSSSASLQRSPTITRMVAIQKSLHFRMTYRWAIALLMMKDYPLSGIGMGSYIIESANYAIELKRPVGTPASPENLGLQIGTELGIPGILFFLWIFWELFRGIFKLNATTELSEFRRILFPGALAGLIAFFINSQAHSYIGSNEIHYLLWFLLALLFAVSPPLPPPGKRAPLRIIALILLVTSSLLLLWNSSHSLSLNEHTKRYKLRQQFGLGSVEKDMDGHKFRWIGRQASLILPTPSSSIALWIMAAHPNIRDCPVRVDFFVASSLVHKPILLKSVTLKENKWEKIRFSIPALNEESVLFLIEVDRTWSPRKAGVSTDPRHLGIALILPKSLQ